MTDVHIKPPLYWAAKIQNLGYRNYQRGINVPQNSLVSIVDTHYEDATNYGVLISAGDDYIEIVNDGGSRTLQIFSNDMHILMDSSKIELDQGNHKVTIDSSKVNVE